MISLPLTPRLITVSPASWTSVTVIVTALVADTFIRQPTQLLNFGRVIDGSPDGERCTQAWDAGHEKADGNTRDTLKDNIKGCGGEGAKQMKDFADHPGPGQVGSGIAMLLAGVILLGFATVLAFTLILAVLTALASAVTLQEILWRAQNIGRKEFKSLQTLLIAAAVYWVLTILFTAVQNRVEARLAASDRNKEMKG